MSWVAVGVGLALAVAGGAVSYNNTRNTQRRADDALATQIRNQTLKQRDADAKVNEQVQALEGSTAADERAQRLNDYMDTLRTNRGKLESGLTPNIGSEAFRADAADTAAGVTQHAGDTAGLLSRIDAANLQRQGEGFAYGNLATDLGLISREARGQNWLDDLRVKRAAQRNAGQDALAAVLSGAGSAVGGMGGSSGASSNAGNYVGTNYYGLGALGY